MQRENVLNQTRVLVCDIAVGNIWEVSGSFLVGYAFRAAIYISPTETTRNG